MYQLGKRFRCSDCGSEALVVKPSEDGALTCCGAEMELREPKAVASAD